MAGRTEFRVGAQPIRCAECDTELPVYRGRGRPRTTCSEACKQRAKRRKAALRAQNLVIELREYQEKLLELADKLETCTDDPNGGRFAAGNVRRSAAKLGDTAGMWLQPQMI